MPYRLIPHHVRERLGRRGSVLVLVGLMWVLTGLGRLAQAYPEHLYWHEQIPHQVLGVAWIASGFLGMAFGFLHRDQAKDTPGFMAVIAMPTVLAASFLMTALSETFLRQPAAFLGYVGFAVYAVVVILLGVIAAWPENGGDRA